MAGRKAHSDEALGGGEYIAPDMGASKTGQKSGEDCEQVMATIFHTDRTDHGYNHDVIFGHYEGDDPTIEDIEKKFYHEYFGGRQAWVDPLTKKFGVTIHLD